MVDRSALSKSLDSETFQSYYYLKEELVIFCRQNSLPTSGGKIELTERSARYLETGETASASTIPKTKNNVGAISEHTLIEPDFVYSEKHRTFFKHMIGGSFSFNVAFQKWLKANTGKTYAQAIEAYYQILEEKKKGKTAIDKQFEYNTYIRDFFEDNRGRTLEESIKCWKYKKGLQGHNRYERTDLLTIQ